MKDAYADSLEGLRQGTVTADQIREFQRREEAEARKAKKRKRVAERKARKVNRPKRRKK